MTRDKKDVPPDILETEDQGGAKREQAAAPAEASGEESEGSDESAILVSIVDDVVDLDQSEAAASEAVHPQVELQQIAGDQFSIAVTGSPEIEQHSQSVDTVVRPLQEMADDVSEAVVPDFVDVGVPAVDDVAVERVPLSTVVTVRPDGQLGTDTKHEISTIDQLELEQIEERVTTMVEPGQTTAQRHGMDGQFFDIDEMDPVFRWGGGSPYGSDRPRFVIHIDKGEVPSLALLQVLLRDTYTEIEGGQPGAETVEFVANEPRIPTVQHNIVTLDLTEGEWQPALRNGEPVIEGQGIDLVSKLQQVVGELYTGRLGYFVLNVPSDWEHPLRRKEFHRKLVETLAGQDVSADTDEAETLVETVRASPVVLAEPETAEPELFFRLVWQYFSLSPGPDASSIGQVEEVQERVLKQNDWRRVALTERQQTGDGASDEHYFWKAAIVLGVARAMWEANDAGFTDFDDFISQTLLQETVIETEADDVEGVDGVPDIYIDPTVSWMREGLEAFLPADADGGVQSPVAIEFETARGEGAFNFRKVQETLEKYEQHGPVYLVVPTRVLFRGRKRAEMINELVESWNDLHQGATLCTPVVSEGGCTGLRPAKDVIREIYGDTNGE